MNNQETKEQDSKELDAEITYEQMQEAEQHRKRLEQIVEERGGSVHPYSE